MEKAEILVIGTNRRIVDTIARLINGKDRWLATVAYDLVELKTVVTARPFKLLLLGAGLTDSEELEVLNLVSNANLTLPIVKHYGGGSGLLYAEICQALKENL